MHDLTHTECQWIGPDKDYTRLEPTCCKPAVKGKSYCSEHVWLVYQQGTAVHRRKDTRQAHSLREIISDMNEVYAELLESGDISEA